jgi:hypothetical protein
MINNIAKVKKSFIVAESSHIDNIQELVSLCLTHDNLLKIDQGLKTLKGRHMLLSSEEVCSIERSVPLQFLIDHPYFWNVAEKIEFTFKLRNLVKQKTGPLQTEVKNLDGYKKWWNNLINVYHSVYVEASKRKRIKQYRRNVDIVRYFGAVYTHINEYEYKVARNGKV